MPLSQKGAHKDAFGGPGDAEPVQGEVMAENGKSHKVYLGDGVYADVDALGDLVLTTEDGIGATNVIVLEPEVLGALFEYVSGVKRT